MRISQICKKLKCFLPQFTDDFSTTTEALVSIDAGIVTVTAPNHGLAVGDSFTLSGFDLDEIINYCNTIETVQNKDAFTFKIVQKFISSTTQVGKLHTHVRIYSTASVQLAIDSYSKQANGEYEKVLYVIDLGANTSKDRGVGGDASFEMMRSTDFKMTLINQFGVLAILPLKSDTIGAIASDFSRELLTHLIHAIVGTQITTDWANLSSAITPISMNRELTNNALIVQNYIFELSEYLNSGDVNRYDFGFQINDFSGGLIRSKSCYNDDQK